MERKLTKVVDGTEIIETVKMCSCGTDVANDLCSWECPDTCGDYSGTTQARYVEVLEFTHFARILRSRQRVKITAINTSKTILTFRWLLISGVGIQTENKGFLQSTCLCSVHPVNRK